MRRGRSRSVSWEGSLPRRGFISWPTRSFDYGARRVGHTCGWKRRATWRRPTSRISPTCSGFSSGRGCRVISSITARSIGPARRVSCAASTSCRCRRPTTSRRALRCSKRWRAACRSSNLGAVRSPRSWSGPVEDCSSLPTILISSPTGCAACGPTVRCARSSDAAGGRASGSTTLSKGRRRDSTRVRTASRRPDRCAEARGGPARHGHDFSRP